MTQMDFQEMVPVSLCEYCTQDSHHSHRYLQSLEESVLNIKTLIFHIDLHTVLYNCHMFM